MNIALLLASGAVQTGQRIVPLPFPEDEFSAGRHISVVFSACEKTNAFCRLSTTITHP
jgi:hypothetical protein